MPPDPVVVRFRTVSQLIDEARTPPREGAGRDGPRQRMSDGERSVLAYLRRLRSGRATHDDVARAALGCRRRDGPLAGALNGLWERRLVRFLPGDVVELTELGRDFRDG